MPPSDRADSAQRLTWRMDALDEWRKQLDGRVAVLESKVGDIVFDDKLAQELAERLRQSKTYTFALWQKVLAAALSVALFAGAIKTLFWG